jgi:hypothetical protein
MDRLPRPFVACGLGLLLAVAGCKATRPEVPPGRPFAKDGQQRKAIEFSSDGHPASASASNNFMPNNLGGSNLASGIGAGGTRPDGTSFGAPPGAYGPPGTAGMAQPPGLNDPSTIPASGSPAEIPSSGLPKMDPPPVMSPPSAVAPPAASLPGPDLSVSPPREARPVPNQVIQGPMNTPGAMGTPDQTPSPN